MVEPRAAVLEPEGLAGLDVPVHGAVGTRFRRDGVCHGRVERGRDGRHDGGFRKGVCGVCLTDTGPKKKFGRRGCRLETTGCQPRPHAH